MGGAVDGEVVLDVKSSLCREAIEKTQAELRQEYGVREERRRELEFLEKGGNPLDFDFSLPSSLSVQSTPLPDRLLENEAKGSFALTTAPHGDSAESSDLLGTSLVPEQTYADKFFDGENSVVVTRNDTSTGKRSTASFGPFSKGQCLETRKPEEYAISHLDVKSQGYARKNNSKSSHENSYLGATDLSQYNHGNRAVMFSSLSNGADAKVQELDPPTISNSKETRLYEKNDSRSFPSKHHLDMELDEIQPHEACIDVAELPVDKTNITTSFEKVHENNHNEQISPDGSEHDPNGTMSVHTDLVGEGENTVFNVNIQSSCETSKSNVNKKSLQNKDQAIEECVVHSLCTGTGFSTSNGLDEQTTCAKDDCNVDGNASGDHFFPGEPNHVKIKEQEVTSGSNLAPNNMTTGETIDMHPNDPKEQFSAHLNARNSCVEMKNEKCFDNATEKHEEMRSICNKESTKFDGEVLSASEGKLVTSLPDSSSCHEETTQPHAQPAIPCNLVHSACELSDASLSQRGSVATIELHGNSNTRLTKTQEDAILKEAHAIKIKRKKAGELPKCMFRLANHQRSHWDYVLEEMAWMANDFMQERLWKITAASQICHWSAISVREKFRKNKLVQKQREIALFLAKAVIKFWNVAKENKDMQDKHPGQLFQLPIQHYAVSFLRIGCSPIEVVPPEAPRTPDSKSDTDNLEMLQEEHFSFENLHYNVPFGAMLVYKEFVEAHWLQHEKMGNSTNQVDFKTSVGDSATEFQVHETMDEDETETSMYCAPGVFKGNRPKFLHKKKKSLQQKAGVSRSYDTCFDLPYVRGLDRKFGNRSSLVTGKRVSNQPNVVSIPTKRVRTAARHRVASPFNISGTGAMQMSSKTDVSSGDTSSFQEDQCSLHSGSHPRKNSDFESTVDFDRQIPFDGNNSFVKPKKKKPKYVGYKSSSNATDCGGFVTSGKASSYEQRLPVDSVSQLEQKDHLKKRRESHHFESNGTSGLYAHVSKKPKILKHMQETSPESVFPLGGPVPSPAASQMSNMPNSSKIFKAILNRDCGRKNKSLKVMSGQSGFGCQWLLFEDQTLIVLVHDLGPNWELVSDAFNSTMQLQCVFRSPKECKERHKFLMENNVGDCADSAEDSGSSQPYPSTLAGIPQGSARQLFQCLQGPMEADTLNDHFQKIIATVKKLRSRGVQDNQEVKRLAPPHSSHHLAISQAFPNKLTEGPLMPTDLCDATTSTHEGLGYHGNPANGATLPSYQGPMTQIPPASGASTMPQGSPAIAVGNNFPSPSTAANAPTRDVQRCGPRSATLPADDRQRTQYRQLISGRNVPGPLPGGNGAGMIGGMSRGMPMTRPGFQSIGSQGVHNLASTGTSNGVGMTSPVNIHPGSGHGQGSTMMRPHDLLQMLRTGQNPEDHRKMMQELQIQAMQGNGQTITPFNGISSSFPNQTTPSLPAQTFPMQQHQQSHHMLQQPHMLGKSHRPHIQGTNHATAQKQAYAMRLAKERQQQRLVHQQQQFPGSNNMSPVQNGSQLPQPTRTSSPMTPISYSHGQQKQKTMPRNHQANASLPNQVIKQRQHEHIQQQHARQQTQQPAQLQTKIVKGAGRGTILMHQNSHVDASQVNGPSPMGNQEFIMQQKQAIFSGTSNSNLPQKPNQPKMYPRLQLQSSKQMSTVSSHPDGCDQGQIQISTNQPPLTSEKSSVPSSLHSASQNLQQKHTNQPHQTMQRGMLHQLSSDDQMCTAVDSMQANLMITPIATQCSDQVNVNPDVSLVPVSSTQWSSEQSFEPNAQTPNAHMSNSLQTNLVGTEPMMPASIQGLVARQPSGNLSVQGNGNGNGNGGAWHQQQQLPPQQQQQQQPYSQHQQLHRQAGQSVVYGRPSNSGQG